MGEDATTTSSAPQRDVAVGVRVSPEQLQRIGDLYDAGLLMDAHALASAIGPLRRWTGTAARIMAGRLAHNLGAPRLGRAMHRRAYRDSPQDPEATYYCCYTILERRGPLAAWTHLRQAGALDSASPAVRGDWLAMHARVLGHLRDFDRAEDYLAQADEVSPQRPWLCVERAFLMEQEDRYEESLAAARAALELRPCYRPAVQAAAHVLGLLDRDGEALELLTRAAGQCQSGAITAQLAALQTELGMFAEARRNFDRLVELSPLAEKGFAKWIAAQRSDAAYYCDDLPAAADLARQADTTFHKKVAESLGKGEGRRAQLRVPFVRQHHLTCAPATLSAISRFWSMPADHLGIVEEICYDGTPAHSERRWAEQHGYVAREFTITWDSARAILDRGVPFTLTTVEVTNAHLQACIGYDSRRGTLLIRDPYERHFGEFIADAYLERFSAFGPRGMVLVPRDRARLLEGIELPDAALYDGFHQVQGALVAHRRDEAQRLWESLAAGAPEHRLTQWARRAIAAYDADVTQQLACTEALLKLHPNTAVLQLNKVSLLRNLARRDERLALLKSISQTKDSDPTFWQQYAQELAVDARDHDRAEDLLRRAMRYRPLDPGNYLVLGNVLWARRRFEEALELYRFATCLDDKDEQLALTYFNATRHFKQTERSLQLLRARFGRFGKRSSQPARTLFRAQTTIDRAVDAFAVLEESLKLRPDDGELLLHAADAYGRYGNVERASALLAQAQGKTRDAARWRTAASLASYRGELKASLVLWQRVLEAEPLAMDAQAAVVQLLAETVSRQAALDHLAAQAARFGHHFSLHQLWVEWLREEDVAQAEKVVRHMIQLNPADAWAQRELALCLGRQNRTEEALSAADRAIGLEPQNSYCHSVRARVLAAAGRSDEAREACRRAIELSVDNEAAIAELMGACDSMPARREALAWVESELIRQVIYGDGLLAYRLHASEVLASDELLADLREALKARPDLWHAWSAVIRQLADTNQLDEAAELAKQATERFPLLPVLWLDLSMVLSLSGDGPGEVQALEQALAIAPGWSVAVRRLAGAHERVGDLEKSRGLLERAVAFNPLDALNHGCLADTLWKLGRRDAAIERMQHAVRLDPDYEWAWRVLRDWGAELNRPQIAVDVARDLTARRGGEARSWLILARTLTGDESLDERLAAIDRALELSPRNIDAHDLRVFLLGKARRFDEAELAARPAAWGERPPLRLRARAAWLAAERGDPEAGLEQMQAVVEEDPTFAWGWFQLAEWRRARGEHDRQRQAAEALVRLAPYEGTYHAILGEAMEQLKRPDEARACYERAFQLAPDNPQGGLALCDMHLRADRLDDAARTLAIVEKHVAGPYVAARAVQLAARKKQRDNALRRYGELCVMPLDDPWPVDSGFDALADAGWGEEALRVLEEAQCSAQVNSRAGDLWSRLMVRLKRCGQVEARLEAFHSRWLDDGGKQRLPEVARFAVSGYVEALGAHGQVDLLASYVHRRRSLLSSDSLLWGACGHGLLLAGQHRRVADWMADWRTRREVGGWMLINLAVALRALKRDAEAHEVSAHALRQPADHSANGHRVWLAYDAILEGDAATAEGYLNRMAGALDKDDRFLASAVGAVMEIQKKESSLRRFCFKQARERLLDATALYPEYRNGVLRRAYRRLARRLASLCGGLRARWFALRS